MAFLPMSVHNTKWRSTEEAIASYEDPKTYDQIKDLTLDGMFSIPRLPLRLQTLSLHGWDEIPPLPPTLKSLSLHHSFLTKLPTLPDHLEQLDLHNNYSLRDLPEKLPTQLKHLNLAGTMVSILTSVVQAPNLQQVYLPDRGLQLSGEEYLKLYTLVQTMDGYKDFVHDKENVMWIGAQDSAYQSYLNLRRDPVNSEVEDMMEQLLDSACDSDNEYWILLAELIQPWAPSVNLDWVEFEDIIGGDIMIEHYKTLEDGSIVETETFIPLFDLLTAVLNRIYSSPWRESLVARLDEEIHEALGHCPTGFFMRVINSLAGFCEDVTIRPSRSEELQFMMQKHRSSVEEEMDLSYYDLSSKSDEQQKEFRERWMQRVLQAGLEEGISYNEILPWVNPLRQLDFL